MVLGLSILNAIEPGSSNLGCTDSSACNYDETAIEDDGNCQYDDACGVCGGSAVICVDGWYDYTGLCTENSTTYCDCSGNNTSSESADKAEGLLYALK